MRVQLGPSAQNIVRGFKMTGAADSAARLEFNMGQETPSVRIDRVSLHLQIAPTGNAIRPRRTSEFRVIRGPAGLRIACGDQPCGTISLISPDGRMQRYQDGAGFVPYGRFAPGIYVVQSGAGTGAIGGMLFIDR